MSRSTLQSKDPRPTQNLWPATAPRKWLPLQNKKNRNPQLQLWRTTRDDRSFPLPLATRESLPQSSLREAQQDQSPINHLYRLIIRNESRSLCSARQSARWRSVVPDRVRCCLRRFPTIAKLGLAAFFPFYFIIIGWIVPIVVLLMFLLLRFFVPTVLRLWLDTTVGMFYNHNI